MVDGKTLCLNMIVKNETANLERCLRAIAPHIGCWVIGDTGSTDGTHDFIKAFFAERGLPGELHSFPFVNFEQARNAALDCAYASPLPYDYLLFCDADMELVVEDPDFRSKLEAPGYSLLQKSGVSYWNTRLVRRDAGARYRGVTHEYVNLPGEGRRLSGAWYIDHASGSNRVDKFERDIRLLSEALKTEPENHRYQFYLAQSLKDAGRVAEAVEAYAKRAGMGGWDEEAWYARLQQARCLRTLKDEDGFLREALAAFNQRPHRAEPLYDLARFYREKGMNDASVLFAETGLAMPPPSGDALFVEDFVYNFGFREEYSIAANYARDPARKDRGFAACNWLALNRKAPAGSRVLARHNLRFYVQPADKMMPSFAAQQVGFTPPDGDRAGNPSVAGLGEQIMPPRPAVNFTLADAVAETPPAIAAEGFSGGSQAIEFDGERLALVDEVSGGASDKNRVCHHRFVWLDAAGALRGVSRPFFFQKRGVEFAAGLAWDSDRKRLLISYGVDDTGAWIAAVDAAEVRRLREDAERLASGKPTESRSPTTWPQLSHWIPPRPLAGTEIMLETLRRRFGSELDRINLQVNGYRQDELDKRPLVVWFQHDVNQAAVQWCKDPALTRQISRCVFVSDWQRERYIRVFGLRPEQCVVLRNAVEMTANVRCWTRGLTWRCAYTSTPFRGLSVLLKAWRHLNPTNAELHIWSSMKLYHVSDSEDRKYQHLYDLACTLPGVVYHGLSPNPELREALRDIHFLTYPNTFEETSCVAVIEAMAAGCRVIAPSLGALPETTAGYARLYPWNADENAHAATFARVLASEMAQPWNGDPKLAEAEQHYSATAYDWQRRDYEWRRLIDEILTCRS